MLLTLTDMLKMCKSEDVRKIVETHREFSILAIEVYENLSLGPCRWSVFSRFSSTDFIQPLLSKMSEISENISLNKIEHQNSIQELRSEIELAKQKAIDSKAAFEQERISFGKETERLTSEFEAEKGRLKSLLDSKTSELERSWKNTERDAEEKKILRDKMENMRNEHRNVVQGHLDEKSKLRNDHDSRISDMNRQIIESERKLNEEKMNHAKVKIQMESKVSDLEREIKRLKEDHRRELERKQESHREEMERVSRQIAEQAARRARDEEDGEAMLKIKQQLKEAKEHHKLMKEHLDVTKDLLNAKNSQVVEIEYQWAAAKAKLAQAQLDREELDADVCVLEDLVTKLKIKAVKTAQDLKSLRLTKKQTTRFYSL